MAKNDSDLMDRLHASGLRKRVAQTIVEATDKAQKEGGKVPTNVKGYLDNLGSVLRDIEDRAKGGPAKRSEAAKKGARTKARATSSRSTAAKKGAATKARSAKSTAKGNAKKTSTRMRAKAK